MVGSDLPSRSVSAPVAETQPSKHPRKPWIKLPVDLKRVGEWISMGRDLAALLFIPFLCLYGAIMVYVLIRFFGTADRPESAEVPPRP